MLLTTLMEKDLPLLPPPPPLHHPHLRLIVIVTPPEVEVGLEDEVKDTEALEDTVAPDLLLGVEVVGLRMEDTEVPLL